LLQAHRVTLKHTHALHAASRLAGFTSWHNNHDADVQRLTFVTLDSGSIRETYFSSWDELANELRHWSDRLLGRGQLPLGVLTLHLSQQALNFATPVPSADDD
jgi:hypothetical protein